MVLANTLREKAQQQTEEDHVPPPDVTTIQDPLPSQPQPPPPQVQPVSRTSPLTFDNNDDNWFSLDYDEIEVVSCFFTLILCNTRLLKRLARDLTELYGFTTT
jgi:hypothetical protein